MDRPVDNAIEAAEASSGPKQRKVEPAKGKRYSPAERQEILDRADGRRVSVHGATARVSGR